ncbi:hypothetical protein MW887_011572 [Aspergillus wentii]|nr:hypothetical protein MW887_011572 [Aspergillus wentii]
MQVSQSQLRRRILLVALALVAITIWSLCQSPSKQNESSTSANANFWKQFQPLLTAYAPNCDPPTKFGDAPYQGFDPFSTKQPPSMLQMPPQDVAQMKSAHGQFVDAISSNPPALPYKQGTRGIVSTAGGSYLPVLVISLRMLRKTGSTLPMEVFLADWTEYEGYICNVVLPSLNAKCVVLSEILDGVPGSKSNIEKYQYKPFAMLFSSFEEILFLDADAFPLKQPELVFSSEPFKSNGLITFPDFWGTTVSPLYYEISSQQQPAPNLRQASESGEIFISRKSHLKTLLLCTYYNFYGPSYYYSLLSQGAAGEGDKETFIAAATIMNEPFYQVSEPIHALGRHTKDGFAGSTMVQSSPIDDYALTKKGVWRVKGDTAPAPSPFFIHANYPKFNPATIFVKNGPAVREDGSYTRAWTAPEDVVAMFDSDVEKLFWTEINWTACALEEKIISWKGESGICDRVEEYWKTMFG